MREWSCETEGLTIRVQSWTRGLRTGEILFVGNTPVDSNEDWVWSRMSACLAAPVMVAGVRHVVEAFIAQGKGKLRACCRILVDGRQVGGDLDAKLMLPFGDEWAATRRHGLVRFLLTTGLGRFGLPYALAAGVLSTFGAEPNSVASVAVQWSIAGIAFGLLMGVIHWRNGQSAFSLRQAKLNRPPRAFA
jgi:hypothetical protein